MKFVTISPLLANGETNPILAATARSIGTTPHNLQKQLEQNLEAIWEEGQKLPEAKKSNWKLRVHDSIGAIFLCIDGNEEAGSLYWSLYPYGVNATNDWPIMEMRRTFQTGRGYTILYDSARRMFSDARDWSPR